jgi:hypothetical protein
MQWQGRFEAIGRIGLDRVASVPASCWLALAAMVLLGGCATMEDMRGQLDAAPSCCATLRELPVTSATPGVPVSFAAGDSAPVYAFKTGKSHFIAIKLPQPRTANVARIEVDHSGFVGLDVYKNTVRSFCPAYMLLDEDFVELKTAPVHVARVRPSLLRSAHFAGAIRVPPEATYLVLLTTKQLLESSLNWGPSGGYIGPYSFAPDAYSSMHSEGFGEEHCAPEANVSIVIDAGTS